MSTVTKSKDYSGQSFIQPNRHDTYTFIDPLKQDLKGKRVFISGASKGIGRSLAISYAQAGASKIAIAARSDLSSHKQEIEDAAKKAGRKAVPQVLSLTLDVTDWTSVKSAAEKVEAEFGGLDILVNNAGYLSSFAKMIDSDPEDWWRDWEVNIKGVYFAKRAFIPLLLKGGDKTIVNISSIGAQGSTGSGTSYQTTKLAINRLTEHIIGEHKADDLLAFAIHPGAVATELAKRMPAASHGNLTDTPELAADTIVFLTSERRQWISGRYISSNWDMEKLFVEKDRIVENDMLKVRLQV